MYRYDLTLWLSDETLRKSIDFTLEKYQKYLKAIEIDGPEHYNAVSRRSKNPKIIRECQVVNNSGVSEIRITLDSEAVLNIPNRALKVYSSYLANGALKGLVRYKSLFRGISEKVESPSNGNLSDEDLLTLLIRSVLRNSKADQALIQAVKESVSGLNLN